MAPTSTERMSPSRTLTFRRGNAVHHLRVHRRAQRCGDSRGSLECRHRAVLADGRLGDLIELGGRDSGRHRFPYETESPGADAPGLSHDLDLDADLRMITRVSLQDVLDVRPDDVDGTVAVDLVQYALAP
jgi:hypothetical protein